MALSELQILFRRCLHRRISASEFQEILKQYSLKQKVRSRDVVSAYINCCLNFCVESDPLLPGYLQELLLSRKALLIDFITALLLQWKNLLDSSKHQLLQKVISVQTRMVTEMNIILATHTDYKIDQSRKSVILTARWLTALARWSLGDQAKDDLNVHNLTEVVGFLLISQLNFDIPSRAPELYTAVQQALDQCMGAYPSVSMELMNKLSTMPKIADEGPAGPVDPQVMEMAAIQFEESIMDTQVIPTRSGTVALLHHLLSTGSTVDDSAVYAFLNTRHSGNHAVMFNDLVFASVDAMIKPAPVELYQSQCQTFIFNKLPSILSIIVTSSFESFSSEQNLIDVWNYMNATNPASAPTGRKFLQICAYFHLISSEVATGLVGADEPLNGLYAKDELVGQVNANHTRGPRLIDELLKNDGNVGSISQAIAEIMNNYCHMRETQHLKDMANTIIRKPAAINAIGMFIKPALFLSPFCTLLDEWKWDDIHGESQPVYDEFGSLFLLILAFKQRLQLKNSDLGMQQRGFLNKYLSSHNNEQHKMSESTQNHLGDWIKSLYIDEGLSDELTSNCSAQEFYLLIPTLLSQSILAHTRGKLTNETLKAGLEYLLEPFLLPSLLPAFGWMENIAYNQPKATQLIGPILIKPPGGEAREIHRTILTMVGENSQLDLLPKSEFALRPPQATTIAQLDDDPCFSLERYLQIYGPLNTAHSIITYLLQSDFHTTLDLYATIIVTNNLRLRNAIQVLRGKLSTYLEKGENLFAEAVVHVHRRVELYAATLTPQEMPMEPFVPLSVANVNLDAVAVPVTDAFQAPDQSATEDIDQVLNEAAAMGMDQLDSTNLDDMYGLQGGDFGLGSLDDLDLDMF